MADGHSHSSPLAGLGQVILVLQGGGALGAYQVGVYQALHEAGIEPDWVIGTSIGAVNAALIAGNPRELRLERLVRFWDTVRQPAPVSMLSHLPVLGRAIASLSTMTAGLPGFFQPNPMAFSNPKMRLNAESAGYYSTEPLAETLGPLVDFDEVDRGRVRLTVGAAHVGTGEMRYFDSQKEKLTLRHVMASGALPPAFPAVRIDGELYWDGGILSNTPTEAVFDDHPRRDSVVFSVHLWNPEGDEPRSLWEVANRQKDLQYASRANAQVTRQRQLHRLRHVIAELAARLPADAQADAEVKALRAFGCTTRMHVVRLLAPRLDNEDHQKDIDFSASGIEARRLAGLADMRQALAQTPWNDPHDPLEGFVMHELKRHASAAVELAK